MTITKLKTKNQITLPKEIVKKLNLKPNELFSVAVDGNCIKLIPVELEPKYTPQELNSIDKIVEKEKGKARTVKVGKEFSGYIKKITK
ncbi:MAG: hypothetical protein A3C43_06965 [Candidatus Schekmanbacteria bacterium RIFCSPHIGHO2_02_FULL_38_11]|uniref:SpoVT-AbrB domain-containing protein n=1 Tax=Candidatus Schekmanbacteria bacterium RIFCSPLOWO2_12_FULL_38_15 TaxID=1817883 RepID=A0A1F7SFE7_9BACT|nr:MAG: hypothetical protein A2043_06055 [Candidatus Schekmanbacteria bacterium GWA2_38_9]OGL49798.1 MAG: hypothetical protein A3C43_06965 [Candidatus Schekmanbacteria bacterium RIFCSPHIGHO2_02_FULL_38_11]OGL51659.1 MAG: hypothetical protein A3H37_12425 [Candidatus Schekmanbacteria bacterium RIFCSPLOWO2_02_FULL_38_14]OGL52502.1 MAG: hypothetical protein A3G31_10975 [Candidatus Schekmanbacteria bacterium RIFCSPLOWO2_12_FULL_38_15]